jgi:hypothetical protein
MKTYILGAGASYGFDESLSKELRPPLTTEFFFKGTKLGIFSEQDFPDLFTTFKKYLKNENLSEEMCDIEKFLQYLADNFISTKPQKPDDFKRIRQLQRALSQSFYFIYQLFRYYAFFYTPKFDSYRRLALNYNNCKYGIITLNYDILFELALRSVNLNYHYFVGPHYPKSVPVAKIHGSINWINSCKGGIAYENIGKDIFQTVTQPIYSNKFYLSPMMVLPLDGVKDVSYTDLIRSGSDYDEPALIPPLANYKDYEKVERYKEVWQFAESILRETSELIVIGCSVRKEDIKFRDLIKDSLKNDIPITIVSPGQKNVMEELKSLGKTKFKEPFESFDKYTKTL